jgi:hypothetical protein
VTKTILSYSSVDECEMIKMFEDVGSGVEPSRALSALQALIEEAVKSSPAARKAVDCPQHGVRLLPAKSGSALCDGAATVTMPAVTSSQDSGHCAQDVKKTSSIYAQSENEKDEKAKAMCGTGVEANNLQGSRGPESVPMIGSQTLLADAKPGYLDDDPNPLVVIPVPAMISTLPLAPNDDLGDGIVNMLHNEYDDPARSMGPASGDVVDQGGGLARRRDPNNLISVNLDRELVRELLADALSRSLPSSPIIKRRCPNPFVCGHQGQTHQFITVLMIFAITKGRGRINKSD